jgi:hypothetical protein
VSEREIEGWAGAYRRAARRLIELEGQLADLKATILHPQVMKAQNSGDREGMNVALDAARAILTRGEPETNESGEGAR